MALNLTREDLNVLLAALNDRESVLCASYERAFAAKSYALADQAREDMKELRRVANIIEDEFKAAQ